MAATAAGGFRRYFGTGKSLSFVRHLGKNYVRTKTEEPAISEAAVGEGVLPKRATL